MLRLAGWLSRRLLLLTRYEAPLQFSWILVWSFPAYVCAPRISWHVWTCLRLIILPAKSVDLRASCGMFAIPKSLTRDRLILDARPSNLLLPLDSRWLATLASAAALLDIELSPQEELRLSGEDVRDCYYNFKITGERAKLYVLTGRYKPVELQSLRSFSAEFLRHDWLVVALNTLAMRDLNAVSFGHRPCGPIFGFWDSPFAAVPCHAQSTSPRPR